MPPDFSDVEYWNARFVTEDEFEWLKHPSDLTSHLEDLLGRIPERDRSVLHIGSGSSTLSLTLRGLVSHPEQVHNVDYSPNAIELGMAMEKKAFGGDSSTYMRWSCVDLLNRRDVLSLGDHDLFHPPCTLIVDKSVADSIACGPDVPLNPRVFATSVEHPFDEHEHEHEDSSSRECSVHPIVLLALHLASLTPPNAYWLSLSFSSNRFLFFTDRAEIEKVGAHLWPTEFWTLDGAEPLHVNNVAGGTTHRDSIVHTPPVYHWLYKLKRTSKSLGLLRGVIV